MPLPELPTNTRGRLAELIAAAWLIRHGHRLLQRNYHCRWGELDLVMHDRDTLVVVEVRYRRQAGDPRALASINTAKQRRIALAASCWLGQHPRWRQAPLRFDAVGITGPLLRPRVRWVNRAFEFDGV